jgi:hypothetical protein
MAHRTKTGGTLALVVASIFIIIIVGIGLFFLAHQLGGGREAQQATDAGNLNVAKRALVAPAIPPGNSTEQLTFGGLYEDNRVNLQIYNRFVGKAMLVALNAQADPGAGNIAKTHAQQELALVEGPNGIGERLWQALKDGSNTKDFFGSISQANSIRMLNWNGNQSASSDFVKDEVSFMRQNAKAPSNVAITAEQFPPGTESIKNNADFFKDRDGTNKRFYPFGYTPISVAGMNIYAVPMRPGEQPHLVSQEHFKAEKTSPLTNGSASLLPPNAFMSNSKAKEMLSSADVTLRSSAIVGTLNTTFRASIPNGFIVVDNKVGSGLSTTIPSHVNDIFSGALMDGVYMHPSGYMASDMSVFDQIKNVPTGDNVPLGLGNGLEPAARLDQAPGRQTRLNELRDQLQNQAPAFCNNQNFTASPCKDILDQIANAYPPEPGSTEAQQLDGLMAVEWLKAEVLRIRAGFEMDGPGCGYAQVVPSCSGLKGYTHGATYSTVPFGNTGTLGSLLNQSGGAPFIASITQRMHQINPDATDYTSIFNEPVAFNAVKVLLFHPQQKRFVLMDAADPGLPFDLPDLTNNALGLPDGTPQTRQNVLADLNGEIINVPGEQGYPNPWDCPPNDRGESVDSATWTPSSGFLNLLGVVKLRNCARAGLQWCCPC